MVVHGKDEVEKCIGSIKAKIMLDRVNNLVIINRRDRKNQDFMTETGLRHNDVADIILRIEVEDYSETVDDEDRPGNILWVFGMTYHGYEIYIKISLRNKVVCISFHEKEHEINYPYRKKY